LLRQHVLHLGMRVVWQAEMQLVLEAPQVDLQALAVYELQDDWHADTA